MVGSKRVLFYYFINTQQVCKITPKTVFYIYRLYYHIKSFDSKCFYCILYYHLTCPLYLCFPPEIISFSPTETQPFLVMLFHAKHSQNSLCLREGYLMTNINVKKIWGQRFEDNDIFCCKLMGDWTRRFQDSQDQSCFFTCQNINCLKDAPDMFQDSTGKWHYCLLKLVVKSLSFPITHTYFILENVSW